MRLTCIHVQCGTPDQMIHSCSVPGVSFAHWSLLSGCISGILHDLAPLIFLQVSWSPTNIYTHECTCMYMLLIVIINNTWGLQENWASDLKHSSMSMLMLVYFSSLSSILSGTTCDLLTGWGDFSGGACILNRVNALKWVAMNLITYSTALVYISSPSASFGMRSSMVSVLLLLWGVASLQSMIPSGRYLTFTAS